MTGGGGGGEGDVFFLVENLHARYFFGSKNLSCIFLGVISERALRLGFLLRSVDQKNIHSSFFSATCVPEKLLILRRQYNCNPVSQVFFGSKI